MSSDPDNVDTGRDQIIQVFEYLKAVNEHRNPAKRQIKEHPWLLWLDDLPEHPAITIGSHNNHTEPLEDGAEARGEEDFVLRVRRPELTPSPRPPDELRPWLRAGWDEPENVEIKWTESKNEQNDEGETVVVMFDSDLGRLESLDRWRTKRDQWRVNEVPTRRAMKIFERLYELHGQMEREAERLDLVLGDGVLSWKLEDGGIFHPVLIQRVQLIFDPKIPEFTIGDSDYGVELYTALFQSIGEVDPKALAKYRSELEQGDYHPLAEESSAFLKGFSMVLSSTGEFSERGRPSAECEHPTIGRSPVLYTRSRTQGFGIAIENVLERIRANGSSCTALQNVVGIEAAPDWTDEPSEHVNPAKIGVPNNEILFGKEANPEQVRIAQRLEKYGSVLVQGPPGTGKSHTIGNLIGHLLAKGKTVLVTSHATKALRVLRQHVVEELRPLCVSVLDSDMDSRRQLEEAVTAISNRLNESDADTLEEEASHLARTRLTLISQLESLQTELLNARTGEYRDIVYSGKSCSPSQAARIVAEGRGQHDWIPGPVALGEPLPLSRSELVELYATNSNTCPEDDDRVDSPLPDAAELLSPEALEQTVRSINELSDKSQDHDDDNWGSVSLSSNHVQQLDSLSERLGRCVNEIKAMDRWCLAIVDAGRSGEADLAPWDHLLRNIEEALRIASDAKLSAATHAPEVSEEMPFEEQRRLASEIRSHLQAGKRLGWLTLAFNRKWKQVILLWRVRGQTPQHAEHVAAIDKALGVRLMRQELALLWDRQMSCHGLPPAREMGDQLEQNCGQYVELIRDSTLWWVTKWDPLIEELRALGFDWERFSSQQPPSMGESGPMMRIVDSVDPQLISHLTATACRLRALHLKQDLRNSCDKLDQFTRPEVRELRRSIQQYDVHGYPQAHTRLVSAINRRQHSIRRRALIRQLERSPKTGAPIAEAWATHIHNRVGKHAKGGLPGDPTNAWRWRQLNDELDRRTQVDMENLSEKIEDLSRRISDTTIELIDRHAWAGQVSRTKLSQRSALIGWLDTIRRIGAGYGRRAPRLRVEARRRMSDCRDAVPVWIMPLARLVESFDFKDTKFNVVIIDEASQCDVMALLAFAIAEQVIVVGDHEQVSPAAIGQKVDVVENLIGLHLQGIPNSHLYDGQLSIYDLARQSFGGTICLVEHFRCVPDIIQFSNHLSYKGNVKPLRDATFSPFQTHVVPYRIEATSREGKVNYEEVKAVASLVIAVIEDDTYEGKSIGVISLVGDNQALEIERLLRMHLRPDQFNARRIVCGNSAHFQGDERDVMFLSMVDTPCGEPLPIRQQTMFQQRYNVAASRARDQMWVVYSVSPEIDLKPGDLRRRLIEHALDPKAITRDLERAEARAESEFEREVIKRLVEARYNVTPQWEVGRYRIDIVVEGAERRLAVECDGDRYHPIEKLPEDMARQAILERLGWKFHRIRGSEFFRDPDLVTERLFRKLTDLGIQPTADQTNTEVPSGSSHETIDAVIRRAAEIRAKWESGDATEGM